MSQAPLPDLTGQRILIAEDEYLLAQDMRRTFQDANADVVGLAPSPARVLELFDTGGADLAVLDVNLGGTTVYEAAAELERRGATYVFLTGYSPDAVPLAMRHVPTLMKPVEEGALLALAGRLLAR